MFWSFDIRILILSFDSFDLEALDRVGQDGEQVEPFRISDLAVLKIHLFGQVTFYFDVSLTPMMSWSNLYKSRKMRVVSHNLSHLTSITINSV